MQAAIASDKLPAVQAALTSDRPVVSCIILFSLCLTLDYLTILTKKTHVQLLRRTFNGYLQKNGPASFSLRKVRCEACVL